MAGKYDDWECSRMAQRNHTMKVPSVIAVREFVQQDREGINFSRRNVFIRDHLYLSILLRCIQTKELTLDHVIQVKRW